MSLASAYLTAIFGASFLMTQTNAAQAAPRARTPDEAAVMTIVEAVGVLADTRDFEALADLYADGVTVDYSSLSGEPAASTSPDALMMQWAATLPGFDRTRHDVSNVRAAVSGDEATATADVVADHWIGDGHWQVTGCYDYRFAKADGAWRVTAMTFTVLDEAGSRDVFGPASEAAAANPTDFVLRRRTRGAVRALLEGLEARDAGRLNDLWAEEAVHELPYAPDGVAKRTVGRQALIDNFATWPKDARNTDYTSDVVLHDTIDPRVIFAEYRGRAEIVATGRTYEQTYGSLIRVEDGKIALFREYFDPAPFAYAFDLGGDDE